MREGVYLFSLDVEDDRCSQAEIFSGRVPGNIDRYLDFLNRNQSHATFFVLGNIARQYPDMVRKIHDGGHEIACHSDTHTLLGDHTLGSFREDIERNLEALGKAGIHNIKGFRAPCFSLTEETSWAYDVLKDLGFLYSSSVVPCKSPLFGWPGFSKSPTRVSNGLWEIPITTTDLPFINTPFSGGVYFRALPRVVLSYFFRRVILEGRPVVGYFHPYDIDPGQDRSAFPEFDDSPLFRWLMFYNRSSVFKKLGGVSDTGVSISRYDQYVESHAGSVG